MRKGFIFDHNKCVGCGACSASCVLENGWTVQPRVIYTYNSEASSFLPIVNLSLACNHCEKPICLEGCPAGSYYRDRETGAVIINESKCIGCKYCQWTCPYDAPKFDEQKRIIGKCNLCYSRIIDGNLPACANACPTGALSFGEITGTRVESNISWFPEKSLDPSIKLTGIWNNSPLTIIPQKIFDHDLKETGEKHVEMKVEWSLVIFSFLATLSVATLASSVINGVFPNIFTFISLIILTGSSSLFHLGKVFRSWRAVANLKTSPLSREIAVFLIYSAVSLYGVISEIPLLLIVSSIIGLILLIIIDSVYIYADNRRSVFFHSGQTFLSSLLIISFFTGAVIPFVFIALIKLVSSIYRLYITNASGRNFGIRFLRAALLVVTVISFRSGVSYSDTVIAALFLTGELFDRIIFYIDFEPMNIKTLIYKHIKAVKDEKKRG